MNNAKPTTELLALAKTKAAGLGINEQIRLTGAEHDNTYWVMNFHGKTYIAREAGSPCGKFFKGEELEMKDSSGKITHYVQRLNLNNR